MCRPYQHTNRPMPPARSLTEPAIARAPERSLSLMVLPSVRPRHWPPLVIARGRRACRPPDWCRHPGRHRTTAARQAHLAACRSCPRYGKERNARGRCCHRETYGVARRSTSTPQGPWPPGRRRGCQVGYVADDKALAHGVGEGLAQDPVSTPSGRQFSAMGTGHPSVLPDLPATHPHDLRGGQGPFPLLAWTGGKTCHRQQMG